MGTHIVPMCQRVSVVDRLVNVGEKWPNGWKVEMLLAL